MNVRITEGYIELGREPNVTQVCAGETVFLDRHTAEILCDRGFAVEVVR